MYSALESDLDSGTDAPRREVMLIADLMVRYGSKVIESHRDVVARLAGVTASEVDLLLCNTTPRAT